MWKTVFSIFNFLAFVLFQDQYKFNKEKKLYLANVYIYVLNVL